MGDDILGNSLYTFLTSEAVTEGHPDKICDQISDAILDAYLAQDRTAHVAVESFVSGNVLTIAGEVHAAAAVDIPETARQVIREIGYTDPVLGVYGGGLPYFYKRSSAIHGYPSGSNPGSGSCWQRRSRYYVWLRHQRDGKLHACYLQSGTGTCTAVGSGAP